jgi:hypothetical protein
VNALAKLFDAVAPALGTTADQLEAVDGHIRVKGSPSKSLTWTAACKKIGAAGVITETGANDQRNPKPATDLLWRGRRSGRRCIGGHRNRHRQDQ